MNSCCKKQRRCVIGITSVDISPDIDQSLNHTELGLGDDGFDELIFDARGYC